MKNPVDEYFRSKRALNLLHADNGIVARSALRFHYFNYRLSDGINGEKVLAKLPILDKDVDVFCDTNIFAAPRLSLVKSLLKHRKVFVVAEAVSELLDFRARPAPSQVARELLDLIFDRGQLTTAIEVFDYHGLSDYRRAIIYYVTLLHIRKTVLRPFIREFNERHGRMPIGRERAELYKQAFLSPRATRLANKGDPNNRFTDEVTVVTAVIHSLINQRDVVLLSFDADIFDQFYKLTSLLRDDYASFRLADDYIENANRYGTKYCLGNYEDLDPLLLDKHASFAVERPHHLGYLLPEHPTNRLIHVIAPEAGGSGMWWAGMEEMRQLLSIKETTFGRNTVRHGDKNAYITLMPCIERPQLPKKKTYAFFLSDQTLKVQWMNSGILAPLRISNADFMRAVADVETPRRF
ncbi:MAG: hypothetical protein HY847_14500 [Betaproteobacteria bacterium]|nr:hypothetical protein [Betaproteobacteria bacterium]